jgi:predicted Zn-dependent protease
MTVHKFVQRHALIAAVIGSLYAAVLLLAGPAWAQDAGASETVEEKPVARDCGGRSVTDNVVDRVRHLFGRSPRTLLSRVRIGLYCAPSVALGAERDLDNRRAVRNGLIPMPAFTEYANGLLERLKGVARLKDIPASAYVAADTNFQADITADGNIFISLAVVESLRSEDELVALLAHELAHIVLGHHETDLFTNIQKQAQLLFAGLATARRKIESYERRGGGNGKLAPRDMQQLQKIQLIIEISDKLIHPSWNRNQELDADRLGLDLTQALGFSYTAMTTVLGYIRKEEQDRNAEAQAQREQMQALAQTDLAKQLSLGLKSLFDALGRKHDDAETRLKSLDEYYEKFYATSPGQVTPKGRFEEVMEMPEVRGVRDGYAKTFTAGRLLQAGQTREALVEADRAAGRRGPVANHALPLLILSKALRGAGQPTPANVALQRSTAAAEPVFASHREYAEQLVRDGKRDAAVAAIERAFETFRKAPNLYPELIGFYAQLGRKERAQELVNECVINLPSIREQCIEAAKST